MNQRLDRINGLANFLHQPALKLVESCDLKLQRKLMVVWGWRSVQEQLLNYQKGRSFVRLSGEWVVTDQSAVVTNAKPGASAHNVVTIAGNAPASVALDVIPLLPDGQPDWNVEMRFWDNLFELAWKVGLDPLGDPIGSYLKGDLGHFEEPAWKLKIADLGLQLPDVRAALASLT